MWESVFKTPKRPRDCIVCAKSTGDTALVICSNCNAKFQRTASLKRG